MLSIRSFSNAILASLTLIPFLSGCPQGDVGAPCNHGSATPPPSMTVTFPALSCNDLLCVYGEEHEIPNTPCAKASDCNDIGDGEFFSCVDNECQLSMEYVLERSMCSKTCESNSDCQNSGSKRPVVDDEDTACESGFSCNALMELGEFCCRKMCVCNDQLPVAELDEITNRCDSGKLTACDNIGE